VRQANYLVFDYPVLAARTAAAGAPVCGVSAAWDRGRHVSESLAGRAAAPAAVDCGRQHLHGGSEEVASIRAAVVTWLVMRITLQQATICKGALYTAPNNSGCF
jgi:hypothetical protein